MSKRYRYATLVYYISLSEHYPDLEEAGEWVDDIVEFTRSYPVKKIEMDKPQLAGQASDIATYVVSYSGGPSAAYLKELDNFSKQDS